MFIKYEAEVSSRVGGGERGVVDFGKLFTGLHPFRWTTNAYLSEWVTETWQSTSQRPYRVRSLRRTLSRFQNLNVGTEPSINISKRTRKCLSSFVCGILQTRMKRLEHKPSIPRYSIITIGLYNAHDVRKRQQRIYNA